MARYAEWNKFIQHLKTDKYGETNVNEIGIAFDKASADVVPKSEVDKWYNEYHIIKDELKQEKMYHRETEKLADKYCVELQTAKSEVAREIFEEIERFLYMHFRFCKEEIGNDDTEYVKGRLELNTQIQNFIAELKKKYAGGESWKVK